MRTLNAPEAGAAATQALDLLRRAAGALLHHFGAEGADARALAFDLWAASHGVAMLALAGHLDPAFDGADPSAILARSVTAVVAAAVRRVGATASR